MIDYLGGKADRLIAAGDAATEAGLDPWVGDRIRFGTDPNAPRTWVLEVDDEAVCVRDWMASLDRRVTRQDWAKMCAESGYLDRRGTP